MEKLSEKLLRLSIENGCHKEYFMSNLSGIISAYEKKLYNYHSSEVREVVERILNNALCLNSSEVAK
jgi:hypothetical protein